MTTIPHYLARHPADVESADTWTLEAVLAHLELWGITIAIADGSPVLKVPRGVGTYPLAQVYPSVRALRTKILEHFVTIWGKPTNCVQESEAPAPVEPLDVRRTKAISSVLKRASNATRPDEMFSPEVWQSARRVWYLSGPLPTPYNPARRLPADVRYVCVEGDSTWTEIPTRPPQPLP